MADQTVKAKEMPPLRTALKSEFVGHITMRHSAHTTTFTQLPFVFVSFSVYVCRVNMCSHSWDSYVFYEMHGKVYVLAYMVYMLSGRAF